MIAINDGGIKVNNERIRDKRYLDKVMSPSDAVKFIKPNMTLGVSGFTIAGYPKVIAKELGKRADAGEKLDLTVYSRASLGEEFDGELARKGVLKARMPYQTNKDLRNQINKGAISYYDVPLGQMPLWVKNNYLNHIDVAIIEATAIDENGNIIPTTSVGASNTYVQYADKIIIEVNTYVPASMEGVHDIYSPEKVPNTKPINIVKVDDRIGTTYIPCDFNKVVAVVYSDIPDNGRKVAPVDDEFKMMASNLIDFLHEEVKKNRLPNPLPPLQAGVGSVSNAVLKGLKDSDFENLTVYSEVLQDSIFDLIDAGKVKCASGTSLTISKEHRDEFFKNFNRYKDKIILRPQEISNHPEVIRRLGVIAINTVIEADLYGNTNSSYIDASRLMNGVGGSGDYCENAGLSIFITKSTAKNGLLSCIVPQVSHVDHTIHEIHVLITEQGVADLRGLDPIERAMTIIDHCAHPKFKKSLYEYLQTAMITSEYHENPVNLKAAFDFKKYRK
ncbi:acetyl-CoA hydrolase/transferase C-terminal domain-containing protein [Erysipelatoclostridium sp. AM42-17]|uniref:acetyl-CoA hydrolase/transferase C-terminal domain-containing protein n=1 Tax=Erysipelatoclostridium sp. AM42-17 TaxID=2293102 RepID=UPI000E532B3F|nr:acetyl-CoA hydrolase/transferase C-terminal domain-containing protein [Erysipelatoclostridium sp. AM42-17]RHS91986.1 acetyl-CoA hydrolase [Erysipelatoclostridium sp. AM42-17]